MRIPPTAVGGLFKSYLQTTLFESDSVRGERPRIFDRRLDLNNPPTAVGGIRKVLKACL